MTELEKLFLKEVRDLLLKIANKPDYQWLDLSEENECREMVVKINRLIAKEEL